MEAVESKIRELLTKSREVETALNEEVQEVDEAAGNRPIDKQQGDSSMPAQGSSEPNPEMEDLSGSTNPEGGLTSEVGKAASNKAKKDTTLPAGQGAGQAPNYDAGTPTEGSVNQATSAGNVHREEAEEAEEEVIAEEELETEFDETESDETLFSADIDTLFADEEHLTEEFKTKAASIFEAVVVARVADEVEEIQNELAEEARVAQETWENEMVEKIDGYLNYVTENWMKENELAITTGLRNEITEDFIEGLKTLFAEHYIEVPNEKYDVLDEMQKQIDELKTKLDESVEEKVAIISEKTNLLRTKVIAEATTDLTVTEAEKLSKLLEEVEFESEDLFAEKVAVIKENYFPSVKPTDEDKMDDSFDGVEVDENSPVSIYAQAISKSVKNN